MHKKRVSMAEAALYNTAPGFDFGKYYYSIFSAVIFMLSLVTDWYFPLSVTLFVGTVLMVLDRLGKGIVLRELIALHSLFVCVFMPIFGYTVYNKGNALSSLWVRYMQVPADVYFSFALPGMSLFVTVLCWPINAKGISDQGTGLQNVIGRIKKQLTRLHKASIYLVVTGVCMFYVSKVVPGVLQFVATLIFWSSFVGVLYLYFASYHKYRRLILGFYILFICMNAILSGMFTIIAYMGITLFSFFFIGKHIAFWKKLLTFIVAVSLLILIQNVKEAYRLQTWKGDYQGNKILLFGSLVSERLSSNTGFFTEKAFFKIYYRTNQGFNVALVMRRFPRVQPHDNGNNLLLATASSLVPRLFWPDKPEAGGKFNMKYYTGMSIRNWSTNVGPLGEAYGSFGVTGGIVYMFFLGFFIRWVYQLVFVLGRKFPLLILWIPVLFYQITYSAESDTLQILNSVFKASFFVWLIYKIFPSLFGVVKKQYKRTSPRKPGTTFPNSNEQEPGVVLA
jgi:hypothetical protein